MHKADSLAFSTENYEQLRVSCAALTVFFSYAGCLNRIENTHSHYKTANYYEGCSLLIMELEVY
jgi:hypothetical protein